MKTSHFLATVFVTLGMLFQSGCKKRTPKSSSKNQAALQNPDIFNQNGQLSVVNLQAQRDLFSQTIGSADRVFFDFNKYHLTDESKAVLDDLASFLNKNADIAILITGRCDHRGTVEYNFTLGLHRAGSVKDYLISKGIREDRIFIKSLGKTGRPVLPGGPAKNRVAICTVEDKLSAASEVSEKIIDVKDVVEIA